MRAACQHTDRLAVRELDQILNCSVNSASAEATTPTTAGASPMDAADSSPRVTRGDHEHVASPGYASDRLTGDYQSVSAHWAGVRWTLAHNDDQRDIEGEPVVRAYMTEHVAHRYMPPPISENMRGGDEFVNFPWINWRGRSGCTRPRSPIWSTSCGRPPRPESSCTRSAAARDMSRASTARSRSSRTSCSRCQLRRGGAFHPRLPADHDRRTHHGGTMAELMRAITVRDRERVSAGSP